MKFDSFLVYPAPGVLFVCVPVNESVRHRSNKEQSDLRHALLESWSHAHPELDPIQFLMVCRTYTDKLYTYPKLNSDYLSWPAVMAAKKAQFEVSTYIIECCNRKSKSVARASSPEAKVFGKR